MKYIFLLAVMTVLSSALNAENFTDCEVLDIRFGSQAENAHVLLNCIITGLPSCGTGSYVGFDKTTEYGKQYLTLFLTAFAGNFKVRGTVQQDCPTWQTNVALLQSVVLKK